MEVDYESSDDFGCGFRIVTFRHQCLGGVIYESLRVWRQPERRGRQPVRSDEPVQDTGKQL